MKSPRAPLAPQPIDSLVISQSRRPLRRLRDALARKQLTLGFIGGSITAEWDTTWPGPVASWFAQNFPDVSVTAENAAIGATGSDSACLRVDAELIERNCDLTFVEYAVNDSDVDATKRARSREGLLRKLLKAGQDVVLVYVYRQEFYADMIAGKVPQSIADFEVLAKHYNLSSVWVGLHALREVMQGKMKWDEWLPDTLHPSHRGSWSYANAVTDFVQNELKREILEKNDSIPSAIDSKNWESAQKKSFNEVETTGPWVLKRLNAANHLDQVLETHTPGATLKFSFSGRGLAFIFNYGKVSSEFRYRIDDGEWKSVERERPVWAGPRGMVRALLISDELDPGEHRFEMEVTHGNRETCNGTECRVGQISIL